MPFHYVNELSKIIFSEKSLSVHMSVCPSVCPSRPVLSRPRPCPCPPQKVIETENFAKQSCQIHYKGDKTTSKVMLPPLLHAAAAIKTLHFWARRSRAAYIQHNLEFYHLSRVGPKQLCALAHLGCTRAASTS